MIVKVLLLFTSMHTPYTWEVMAYDTVAECVSAQEAHQEYNTQCVLLREETLKELTEQLK